MKRIGPRRATVVGLAAIGWCLAGLLALAMVRLVGWFGLGVIGVAILYIAYIASIDEENAGPLAVQYKRVFESSAADQLKAGAARAEFGRILFVARTIGLALCALGFNMWIYHQL